MFFVFFKKFCTPADVLIEILFVNFLKTCPATFDLFQVRHKMTKKVYAMKTLSKFEMVTFVPAFVTLGTQKYVWVSCLVFLNRKLTPVCTRKAVSGTEESK